MPNTPAPGWRNWTMTLLSGQFERLGINGLVSVGFVLVALNSLKFLAASWLTGGRLGGAVLQLVLLSASSVFWYGFATPYGPAFSIPQVVLIALVWGQLAYPGQSARVGLARGLQKAPPKSEGPDRKAEVEAAEDAVANPVRQESG